MARKYRKRKKPITTLDALIDAIERVREMNPASVSAIAMTMRGWLNAIIKLRTNKHSNQPVYKSLQQYLDKRSGARKRN
jgi:hypothetical protein